MNARGLGRRTRHEAAAAHESASWAGSPEIAYERLEMHRAVVDAVMSLDEPLRTTVLLRYFEERSSSEISRLTGVPAGTVRWRLSTAIERVRADLDRKFGGDRRKWAVALAPLGKGVLVFMAKSKSKVMGAAVVLVALLGGGAWLLKNRAAHGPSAGEPSGQTSGRRWSGWALPPEENPARGAVTGAVFSPDGYPVEGAFVTLIRAVAEAGTSPPAVIASSRSGSGGRFRFDHVDVGTVQVAAMAHGFAPGRRGGIAVDKNLVASADVRLGTGGILLGGRVTDVGGGPVSGAVVVAVVSFSLGARASPYVLRAVTDESGAYRLTSRAGAHRLRVEAAGYSAADAYLHLRDDRTRDFQLTPAARVSGRVVIRGSGLPVADAEVLLIGDDENGPRPPELDPVRSDAEGRFVFTSVTPGRHAVTARKGPLARPLSY